MMVYSWYNKYKRKLNTFKWKSPNKFDLGSEGAPPFIVFDPTNMMYSPIPKLSMAIPTKNISAKNRKFNKQCYSTQ